MAFTVGNFDIHKPNSSRGGGGVKLKISSYKPQPVTLLHSINGTLGGAGGGGGLGVGCTLGCSALY